MTGYPYHILIIGLCAIHIGCSSSTPLEELYDEPDADGEDARPLDLGCYDLRTIESCNAANCIWSRAGCGDIPALYHADFCMPHGVQGPCDSDSECGAGWVCESIWVSPECTETVCSDVCGAEAHLCFPEDRAFHLSSGTDGPCEFFSDEACPDRPHHAACDHEGLECFYSIGGALDGTSGVHTAICTSGFWRGALTACSGHETP